MSNPDKFPACNIHYMEQRTDEWFDVRRGTLTASDFGPWLLQTTKVARKTWWANVARIAMEKAGAPSPPVFPNWAMKRGIELEEEAVESFEKSSILSICPVGFCKWIHGCIGCSPDGLIFSTGEGFEGKAPIPATQGKYLLCDLYSKEKEIGELFPNVSEDYKWQVKGSIAVTGAKGWWVQSYNPSVPPSRYYVQRDKEVDELLLAFKRFDSDVKEYMRRMAILWDEEAACD